MLLKVLSHPASIKGNANKGSKGEESYGARWTVKTRVKQQRAGHSLTAKSSKKKTLKIFTQATS